MENVLLVAPSTINSLSEYINASLEYGHRLIVIVKKGSINTDNVKNNIELIETDEITEDVINEVKLRFNNIKAIIPGSEFTTVLCDKFAEKTGIFFNHLCDEDVLRNKRIMRGIFSSGNISQPEIQAIIQSEESIDKVNWDEIDYPVIVKPSDMAGSIFVRKCNTMDEVIAAAKPIFSYEKSKDTGLVFEKSVLLEQFIQGDEYSAECIVSNGKLVDAFFVKKVVSNFPYCDEIGHVTGIKILKDIEIQMRHWIQKIIDTVELQSSVLHVEFKIDKGIPYVIEVGNRVAGGNISGIVKKAFGVSLERAFYQIRCGLLDNDFGINKYQDDVKLVGVKFKYYDVKPGSVEEDIRIVETKQNGSEESPNYDKKLHGIYFNGNRSGHDIFVANNLEKAVSFIRGV